MKGAVRPRSLASSLSVYQRSSCYSLNINNGQSVVEHESYQFLISTKLALHFELKEHVEG